MSEFRLDDYSADELQSLIAQAQSELQRREQARVAEVRAEMERLAASIGLSVADLIPGATAKPAKAKADKVKVAPKFKHPENPALTWSGRGKRPVWLRQMVEQGVPLERLAA